MAIAETLASFPEIAGADADPVSQAIAEREYEFFLEGIGRKLRLHKAVVIEGTGGVGKSGLIHALDAYIKSPYYPYAVAPETLEINANELNTPQSLYRVQERFTALAEDETRGESASKAVLLDHVESLTATGDNYMMNVARSSFLGSVASQINEEDNRMRLIVAHRNPLVLPRSSRGVEPIADFVGLFDDTQSHVQFNGIDGSRDKADASFRTDRAEIKLKAAAYLTGKETQTIEQMDLLDLFSRV